MVYAPIALFVYNRPTHLARTLQALRDNPLAHQSRLYIYSDGPKTPRDETAVTQVRQVIKEADGFAEVIIHEQTANIGLARSIIAGVTELSARYGSVIVLEDDLVVAPGFLTFMNQALEHYQHASRVMTVSGYLFPVEYPEHLASTFFFPVPTSWGWGTWHRAWKQFEPDSTQLLAGLSAKADQDSFDVEGAYPYYTQLKLHAAGKLDVWGVRWYASMFAAQGLCLYPGQSLVQNIGMDGSGMHCNPSSQFDVSLSRSSAWHFSDHIEESPVARNKIRSFFIKLGAQRQKSRIAEMASRLRMWRVE
ncbi:MAG: glycosyltransferase [Nitrospira sp.]|nr:glycosyltransferase [Nitrospira sp.]